MAHIINTAIYQGTCPSQFKNSDICPIYKSGSKKELNNYRPISLISNLAKVFEKIIFSKLYNFVINNHLISVNQFGFLKNKGANDAIALLSDYVYEKLGCSDPTIVAFLDYSKAFDTVDHNILL